MIMFQNAGDIQFAEYRLMKHNEYVFAMLFFYFLKNNSVKNTVIAFIFNH